MPDSVSRYRVLVIDDNAAIHDDFRKVLAPAPAVSSPAVDDMEALLFGQTECENAPTYDIDTASQGPEGLAKIIAANAEDRPYAMVFTDMRMPPGWDGVQTLREIWKAAPGQQAAICTAYSDYTPDQIASELGVRGKMVIIRKPFEPTEVRQLAAMVCEKWELSRSRGNLEKQVEARTAELRKAALHDGLTGLPNRMLLADRIGQALARSRREPGYKFAVLFVDCDNFKTINDTLGHHAGDSLLRQIAGRLQAVTRCSDTVAVPTLEATAARVGGDEFALLLGNLSGDADAARVAQRLLDAAVEPYVLVGKRVSSGMSVGVTTNAVQYTTADDMLRDADTAMYQAKNSGRGRFVMFDQARHDAAVSRLTIESELRTAVENGEIRPYFQPIIATGTRSLVGFEALARWHHPVRGVLAAGEFIPLAEETGAILLLGMRMLEESCKQLVAWQQRFPHLPRLTMSVNVSRKQLVWPLLVQEVTEIIRRTGVIPQQIKLEVTESTVMDNSRKSVDVLHKLRELDVQLHMDDFGSGYSSLSCLQKFPLDGLKLDGGFVSDLTGANATAGAGPVLAAVSALAHGLKLPVVAEGVESDAQFEQLKALGCEFAQGYLFAPPLDSAGATAFVAGVASFLSRAA